MSRFWVCIFVLVTLCFLEADYSRASRPWPKTLTGCVIHGRLYSIYPNPPGPKGEVEPTIYPITIKEMDLTPFEGKKIQVHGKLLPGDRFYPDPATIRILGPCDKKYRDRILKGRSGQ